MTENKKTYVSPKIQVFCFNAGGFFAASNNVLEKSYFLCPYIPETKCYLYHEYIKQKFGVDKLPGHETRMRGDTSCPYKNSCEDYELYCKVMNEKQR